MRSSNYDVFHPFDKVHLPEGKNWNHSWAFRFFCTSSRRHVNWSTDGTQGTQNVPQQRITVHWSLLKNITIYRLFSRTIRCLVLPMPLQFWPTNVWKFRYLIAVTVFASRTLARKIQCCEPRFTKSVFLSFQMLWTRRILLRTSPKRTTTTVMINNLKWQIRKI